MMYREVKASERLPEKVGDYNTKDSDDLWFSAYFNGTIFLNGDVYAWLEPIEITEEDEDALTKEAIHGLKSVDRILPEFYFRLGIEAILSKLKGE